MATARKSRILRAVPLLIAVYLLSFPTQAQYSGGTGEPNDPYQIATAEDLMLLGDSPEDYDEHFILTTDIDLDPNLPGRKVFERAAIAPDTDPNKPYSRFHGTSFTGVFDGNGYCISHLTIAGESYLGLFGHLGNGAQISNLYLEAVDVNGTGYYVGSLGGGIFSLGIRSKVLTNCYSTGTVSGDQSVGGLVGINTGGEISSCYSKGTVSGYSLVGGLVGQNGAWFSGGGGDDIHRWGYIQLLFNV